MTKIPKSSGVVTVRPSKGSPVAISSPLPVAASGQERDRSLERIAIGLQQAPAFVSPYETDRRLKLGPLTLVAPVKRGEFIRLSLPVGEYVYVTT